MDITTKVTGNSLTATEFMQIVTELENSIEDSGQVLSSGTLDQISKALSNFSSSGNYYNANAVANSYVLSTISPKLGATAYQDGMKIRFTVGATNTGASTANVNSLGAKAIVDIKGNALTGGELQIGDIVDLVYVSASNHFKIFKSNSDQVTSIDNTDSPYTALISDKQILCDTASGVITVNLPAAANYSGKTFTIKKISSSSHAVTIDPNGAETIDGETTITLDFINESVTIFSDGANWKVLSHTGNSAEYSLTVADTNWTTDTAVGLVTKSLSGDWRMVYNIDGSYSSGSANTLSLAVTGITTPVGLVQAATVFDGLHAGVSRLNTNGWSSYVDANTNIIYAIINTTVTIVTDFYFSGNIKLSVKPSFIV